MCVFRVPFYSKTVNTFLLKFGRYVGRGIIPTCSSLMSEGTAEVHIKMQGGKKVGSALVTLLGLAGDPSACLPPTT